MIEVKPVYQAKSGNGWIDIEKLDLTLSSRILYPSSVVEALQADHKENYLLLQEALQENEEQAKRIAELEVAFNEWIGKTEFVQKDEDKLFARYLGMHRADAMHSVIRQQAKCIADLETPLTDAQYASACLSYRHDFGLLIEYQKKALIETAKGLDQALRKERILAAAQKDRQ